MENCTSSEVATRGLAAGSVTRPWRLDEAGPVGPVGPVGPAGPVGPVGARAFAGAVKNTGAGEPLVPRGRVGPRARPETRGAGVRGAGGPGVRRPPAPGPPAGSPQEGARRTGKRSPLGVGAAPPGRHGHRRTRGRLLRVARQRLEMRG